ncbi:RluA family pseudouridine synthase [Bacteroides gallinarum]|uniref:RluA family pseudouridine synthase n=1 Tax=Bacteroides gallinarum TaxID=376806 RepID=UPI00037D2146|nr:RluA family pseudouridine synthase [Bacteroides gallinarum]
MTDSTLLHSFRTPVAGIPLPEKFTFPFCYTPHPLCVSAAEEVQDYLARQDGWQEELAQGKMFGVLVVETEKGEIGYLVAFSGILAGKSVHPFFVPPVYDLQQPQGFFKAEEEQISHINARIAQLETDAEYTKLLCQLTALQQTAGEALKEARQQMKAAKEKREERRRQASLPAGCRITPEEENALIRESQFQKAEYKRMERAWKARIAPLQQAVSAHEACIQALKAERKARSAALQQKLFEQFRMLNYRGEVKTLCDIFGQTVHKTPPAGAGECAAPKLLQQAYLHGWKPVAMAEFWWGASPKTEIRHHGHYYPACKGKCEPILKHMLQGLEVDENPILKELQRTDRKLETVYEDEYLAVVGKPAGMLSVPGKEDAVSVYSLMRRQYPDADSPLIVHRLDMDTSGLLVIAKTKQVHQHLQAQFKNRSIRKRYIALLEGTVVPDKGRIELPLCPNPLDRPRQMVHTGYGKPAITDFEVLERKDNRTRIAFYPRTGRTHQLRVHAAHPLGLHCPIIGDGLYGKKAGRLYLHAETLEFIHPVTGEKISITQAPDF